MQRIYFTCSFDDGDVADLRLAELLKKYDLKGTFYVPQECCLVNKSLSEWEIKELATLVEIGGHTISHQVLTETNLQKAKAEIKNCKNWLENTIGKQIHAFCPPTGRFTREHISFQKEAGFTSMRTVEMLSFSIQKIKVDAEFVVLPTTCQVYNHKKTAYLKNCVKRMNFSQYPVISRLYNNNWQAMSQSYISYLNKLSVAEDVEYYFHLWGHSWEIEKYSLWNSLESFFMSLKEIDGIIACDNSELAEIVRLGN